MEKLSTGMVSGLEVEFVEEISADWICSVCQELINDVRETVCGHLFCASCITSWMSTKSSCPVCRTQNDSSQIFPARYVDRLVQNIKARCPKQCGADVSVRELKEHVSTTCPKRLLTCSVCSKQVTKGELAQHVRDSDGHLQDVLDRFEKLEQESKKTRMKEAVSKSVAEFPTCDVLIDGRDGTNSFVNGIWVYSGIHGGFPYYMKSTDYLYCVGQRWRISRTLGEASKINAYFDQRPGSPTWVVFDGDKFEPDPVVYSCYYMGFDIRITGRKGTNSHVNGLWRQRGVHDAPYYVKDDWFLYLSGDRRWRISKELGASGAKVQAYCETPSDQLTLYKTPDRLKPWKFVSDQSIFVQDDVVSVQRSFGLDLKITGRPANSPNCLFGIWSQKGAYEDHPYYSKEFESQLLFLYFSGSMWYVSGDLGATENFKAFAEERTGSPEGIEGWHVMTGNSFVVDETSKATRYFAPDTAEDDHKA